MTLRSGITCVFLSLWVLMVTGCSLVPDFPGPIGIPGV